MITNKPCLSTSVQQGWQKLLRLTSLYLNTSVQITVTSEPRLSDYPEGVPAFCEIHWPDGALFGYLTTERSVAPHETPQLEALAEMIESDLKIAFEGQSESGSSPVNSFQGLEKMLRTSLEASNEAILLLNMRGEIIHYNSQLVRMWNLGSLIKRNVRVAELTDYVEKQLINSSFTLKGYASDPKRFSMQRQTQTLYLKDGRTIERTSLPIVEKERTIGRVFSYRDITPQQQTEQALQEKTDILDTIFDQAPILMMLVDEQARIEKVNRPGVELSRFGPNSEIAGRLIGDILHCVNAYPDICGTSPNCRHCAVRQTLNRTIQTGESRHKVEGTMQIKQEHATVTRHILISSATIATPDARKYLLSIDDITERYLAEKSLIESENRFRNLFEYTPIAYQALDENGCFLDINNEWSKLTGYSREEIIGTSFGELFSAETKTLFAGYFGKFVANGYINDLEITLNRKNGEAITALVTGRIQYDNKGNYLRSHCIMLNFTERKQIQRELIQAKEKAEEATRIKSAFLANISHEIRTPMNAILGYAEILNQSISEPAHRDYLSSMQSSGKILMDLINDVLDFSKIDAGKMELKKHPVDIRHLLAEIADTFRLTASQKGVRLVSRVSEQTPRLLLLDELRLRQIMLNLLSNALKFTSKGTIRVDIATLRQDENGSSIQIRVEDTGIGIAEKEQKKIFEAFEQIDNQDGKIYGGTGLGLAITQRLVRLMGGEMSLESKLNKGSTFSVTLPNLTMVGKEDEAEADVPDTDDPLPAGTSLLIVDDNRANRKVTRGFFGGSGVKITEAVDGARALEILKSEKPQLILIDLRMPGLSGFQTARAIKDHPQGQDIPLIAYTASELSVEEEKRCAGLFDALIKKPVDRKRFMQTVRNCLSAERLAHPAQRLPDDDGCPVFSGEEGNELLAQWKNLQKIRPRKTLKKFIEEVSAKAETTHHPELVNYIQELEQAFQTFNIEKEKALFHDFPRIIEKLKIKEHE